MKKRIAAIFAGQGSQFPGMGKELYAHSEAARAVFARAVDVMGKRILDLCFDTDLETLTKTVNAQPAIFTVSYAAYAAFQEALPENAPVEIVACSGHSLGEYTALVASGAASFERALAFVVKRAEYMQAAGEANDGTMAAVMGLAYEPLEALCRTIAQEKNTVLSIGLFNTPSQIVVTGARAGIDELCLRAKPAGAKRALPLPVGGPFHSAIMEPAARNLEGHLPELALVAPRVPIALNAFGEVSGDPARIAEGIIRQIHHPILWVRCVEALAKLPVDLCLEFCPKTVLKGLVNGIEKSLAVHAVENPETLGSALAALSGGAAQASGVA